MKLTQDLLQGLLGCAEALYVIEEASKTVVYASCIPGGSRHVKSYIGQKCYQAFLGKEEPCPFCPSLCKGLSDDTPPYSWDYFDPASNQWLKIKNRLVLSEGVWYRVGNVNLINDMMGLGSDAVKEVGLMQRLIREHDEMREQLLYELSHDRLTGLLNRNQYIRDLKGRYRGIGACGVLFFDINNLKVANDRYNHSEGDSLLCRLADAMHAHSGDGRRSYRVGGDEFLMVLVGCTWRELHQCQDDILRELKQRDQGQRLPCSVAVGSAWDLLTENVEHLVSEADRRMYEEKRRAKFER